LRNSRDIGIFVKWTYLPKIPDNTKCKKVKIQMVMLSRKEKEKMAIEMLNRNVSSRKILEKCNLSPNVITALRRKLEGVGPAEPTFTQAYRLFEAKKSPYEVAIELRITAGEATKYFYEYCRLRDLNVLLTLYNTLGHNSIEELGQLHRVLTQNGVSAELYGLYIRKATQIDRLESRERVVSGQNYKISNENLTLVKINERLRQENYDLKRANEWLNGEGDRLKWENDQFTKNLANAQTELSGRYRQKGATISSLADLYTERDRLEKEDKAEW
jgi:hypothetical protein